VPRIKRGVVTCIAAAVAATAAIAGCAGARGGPSAAGSPTAPQALEAEAVASQEFGLLAGGGWAQAWGLWTAQARQAVSRSEYVQVNAACPPSLGVSYVVEDAVRVDADTMRVTWRHDGVAGANLVVYQDGTWRFAPAASELAPYKLGADQLIRQRKAQHACR
jgi:hypothetical protein